MSSELAMAIPYGLPWEDIVALAATPEIIAHELRRRGIWTAEDLRDSGGAAMGAIQSAYGLDLSMLRLAAKAHLRKRGR